MSPEQGWFESDEDYRNRVAREADERTIQDSTGSAPSQGWFENDDSYRERIAREANESTIEAGTGEAPSQGWFENDEAYNIRVRKEANEEIVKSGTGSSPKQGWFEGNHEYRSRIAHQAREARADGVSGSARSTQSDDFSDSSGTADHSAAGSDFSVGFSLAIVALALLVILVAYNRSHPPQPEVRSATVRPPLPQSQAPPRIGHRQVLFECILP